VLPTPTAVLLDPVHSFEVTCSWRSVNARLKTGAVIGLAPNEPGPDHVLLVPLDIDGRTDAMSR